MISNNLILIFNQLFELRCSYVYIFGPYVQDPLFEPFRNHRQLFFREFKTISVVAYKKDRALGILTLHQEGVSATA